jgi:hypothetical protein
MERGRGVRINTVAQREFENAGTERGMISRFEVDLTVSM